MGFILEPKEALSLIRRDNHNMDVLFPFLNGEDFNTHPDQSPSRWVINFFDWPLEKAETYPDCIEILREKVKPERQRKNDNGDYVLRKPLPVRWWIYGDKRPALYSTIAEMTRVLVCPIVTKYLSFCFVPANRVFSDKLCVFPFDHSRHLALLNSNIYENWAREYSGTLGTTLQYTPSDSFETFPFPSNLEALDSIGERYYIHRRSIMLARQEGLTKTYNRFHDPGERAPDIVTLRALQKEMDEAVARAYGWDDLKLEHDFHETKQGLRYTISEAARREVLDSLLLLNHQRHEEEVRSGMFDKGTQGKKSRSAKTPNTLPQNNGKDYNAATGINRVTAYDVEQNTLF